MVRTLDDGPHFRPASQMASRPRTPDDHLPVRACRARTMTPPLMLALAGDAARFTRSRDGRHGRRTMMGGEQDLPEIHLAVAGHLHPRLRRRCHWDR